MSYRDSQRFRKVYGYYRPIPRPTDTSTLADKDYVDEVVAGIDWKQSVRAASTTNVNLSLAVSSVDNISFADEDRVLIKNQTAAAENGIYIYYSSTGNLTRTLDAAQDTLTGGAATYVEEGTENNGTAWLLSTSDPITVGTTSQTWVLFSTIYPAFIKSGSYAKTTSKTSFSGQYADAIGSNVFFYVSGTIGQTASPQISVFGGDIFVSGSLTANQGLSGSLTKLADGTSYLVAGSDITIASASNGAVTISSTAAGTPGGNNTYIQFNDGGSFGGDSGLTYNKTSNKLFVSGAVLIGTSSAPTLEIFVANQVLTSSGNFSTAGSRFVSVLTGSELFNTHFGLHNTATSKAAIFPLLVGQGNFAYHASTSSISNLWGYYNAAIVVKPDDGTTAGLLSTAVGDASVMGFFAAENFSGSITNAYGFRYNNTGINSNRTITNSFGMQILNVGAAAGVTNAIGLDIASINTASGIKLGIRSQDPIVIGSSNTVGSEKLRIVGDTRSEGTLTSVGDIIPDSDTTYNLGSASTRWANIYTGDLHLKNDRGDYTLIEEEGFLSIRFNKTGQRYKFLLERVPDFDEYY